MENAIKATIFDFGGVLIDWNPRYLYQKYFYGQPQRMENFLTQIDFYEWNNQQDKGRLFPEGISDLSAEFPQYAHLIQAYYDCWEESIKGPINESVKILYRLKQNGFPLFGSSNWSAETYPRVRQKYPFFDWFDDVILSGNEKLNKPDPAIFKLILNKIGYLASQCVLIDDYHANIEAAKKMGFTTIHFISPEQLYTELQSLKLVSFDLTGQENLT